MPAEHSSIPAPPITLRPELGLPKFRRNASLRLEEGAIVATDRRGRSRRFPLDGTPQAPAEIRSFGLQTQGLVDGTGELLAVWEPGFWDGITNFLMAANLKWVIYDDTTLPPMRADGIKIFDIPALSMMSTFSSIGIVAFAASQFEIAPDIVTVPIMAIALAAALVSLVLWRIAERLEPEVAERRRREMEEAMAQAWRDVDDSPTRGGRRSGRRRSRQRKRR